MLNRRKILSRTKAVKKLESLLNKTTKALLEAILRREKPLARSLAVLMQKIRTLRDKIESRLR